MPPTTSVIPGIEWGYRAKESPLPVKPNTNEEEFFAKQTFERRKKAVGDPGQQLAPRWLARREARRWICCPKDSMELMEVEFLGVKIDPCSHCGRVFLDAGELDGLAKAEKGGFLSGLSSFFKG
jgi:hypothetical protein